MMFNNEARKRSILRITLFLATIGIAGCAVTSEMQAGIDAANELLMTAGSSTQSRQKQLEIEAAEQEAKGRREFAGINFGVGISLSIDTGDNDRVNSAEIVNDIVRVTDVDDTIARVMLESHYFFQPEKRFINLTPGNWGVGPFIALQPGTEEIIEAVGIGLMLGFKRPGEKGESWNLGIGFSIDPNRQLLGDGFIDNQAPPNGEMQVRFKEKSQTGILILASFGF